MTCLDDQSLALWASGRLTPEQASAATEHLETCADCRLLADLIRQHGSSKKIPSLPSPSEAARPGEQLGRYMVLEWVGRGGMGDVFAAWDATLNRKVALKLLTRATDVQQAFDEARAMAGLSHPAIATVFEAGQLDGRVYLAMEFLSGGTLRSYLGAQRRLDEVVSVFARLARGLHHAHTRQVVHRDFKPENVVFGDDGKPRITDFGLATRISTGDPRLVVGTLGYVAPEVCRGEPASAAADQFSFGIALRSALKTQNLQSRRLRAAIERMLEPEALERFASMREVARELDACRPKVVRRRLGLRVGLAAVTAFALTTIAVFAHRARACDPGHQPITLDDSYLTTELSHRLDEWRSFSQQRCLAGDEPHQRCAQHALTTLSAARSWSDLLAAPSTSACRFDVEPADVDRAQALVVQVLASGERCPDESIVQQAVQAARLAHLPAEPSLWAELGECRVQAGRLTEATFLMSLGDEVARTLPPDSLAVFDYRRRRVRLLLQTNQLAEAEAQSDALVARSTDVAGPTHWFTAYAHVARAEVWMMRGRFAEVADTYRHAVGPLEEHFGPSDVRVLRARHNFGAALLSERRYAEAWAELSGVLERRAQRPTALTSDLSTAALGMGHLREALSLGRESIRDLAERDVRVFSMRNQQFVAWGLAELAAVEAARTDPALTRRCASTVLMTAHRGADDGATADDACGDAAAVLRRARQALEVEPLTDVAYDAEATIRLLEARALRLLGRRDEALDILEQARRSLPGLQRLVPVSEQLDAEKLACANDATFPTPAVSSVSRTRRAR